MVEECDAQRALCVKGEGWNSESYWNGKAGDVDHVVTATWKQAAFYDYILKYCGATWTPGTWEGWQQQATGGIWLGSQATAGQE